MNKKTVLIGASTKPERDAHSAAMMLMEAGNELVLLGIREGDILGNKIITVRPEINDVDTITLYINATNQQGWYDYMLSLKPKRVIFNPGTENSELTALLDNHGIGWENQAF